jgi:phosphotransferase system IIA component
MRYDTKINQLIHNNIDTLTMKEQAFHLIKGLQIKMVYDDVLMKIDEDSSWYRNKSTQDIMYKARDELDKYLLIHSDVTQCDLEILKERKKERKRERKK